MIVQLKDNQLLLCRKVKAFCQNAQILSGFRAVDAQSRNRHETRIVGVFTAAAVVKDTAWAPYIKAIIQVERKVLTFQPATGLWKESREASYYLSSRSIKAARAADAIRQHWRIENSSHYVRDVTMREDASRIRINPGIFARLRSFAYNILRFNQHGSIPQDRYAAALGGFDALKAMRLCIEN